MCMIRITWPSGYKTTAHGSFTSCLSLGRDYSKVDSKFAWQIVRLGDGVTLVVKDAQ